MYPIHVCIILLCIGNVISEETKFSEKFKFGVGTSAYQIEGAWEESEKGESIWDRRSHVGNQIFDGSNGDIACDSYHKFEEDIELLKQLKVQYYRFSLSWTRLFPLGLITKPNKQAVKYYNSLINALVEANIEPMVTLFHWDTPQALEELGGWNSDKMIEWFSEYADQVFKLFGDRVKTWITLNEPTSYCYTFNSNTGIGTYLCGHNQIKAHAKVYHMYQEKYKQTQKGAIGISLLSFWAEPKDPQSTEDQEAAKKAMDVYFGWFAVPVFNTGDYPKSMKESVAARSKEQGFPESRLPVFTDTERLMIRKSADFLGLNFYSGIDCTFGNDTVSEVPAKDNDDNILFSINEKNIPNSIPIFSTIPDKLTDLLVWINQEFGGINVIITENGYNGDETDDDDDSARIHYLNTHLLAVLDAIKAGVSVTGYIYWSLMDNFDWYNGYTRQYGLYSVDFEDPERPRTPRKSAMVYQHIIETSEVDIKFNPKNFDS